MGLKKEHMLLKYRERIRWFSLETFKKYQNIVVQNLLCQNHMDAVQLLNLLITIRKNLGEILTISGFFSPLMKSAVELL